MTHIISHKIGFILLLSTALGLGGCATANNEAVYDPLEPVNRVMFNMHEKIDTALLKPVARGWRYVPEPARDGVRNFFANLGEPYTFVNDILQGKMKQAGTSLTRFTVNSTIGIVGLIDVASHMGLEAHREDFGQTLGIYGMGEGVYLFIPLLGPTNMRDGLGWVGTQSMSRKAYDNVDIKRSEFYTAYAVQGIDTRARLLDTLDDVKNSSVDYYASIRSIYTQNRRSEISNGETDVNDLPDIDDMDDWDDENAETDYK